jgi:hypothetical protein
MTYNKRDEFHDELCKIVNAFFYIAVNRVES